MRGDGGLGVHRCPGNSQCQEWGEGPNYGFVSFEDFRKGLLTVFQLITLEGWSAVFYLVSWWVPYTTGCTWFVNFVDFLVLLLVDKPFLQLLSTIDC